MATKRSSSAGVAAKISLAVGVGVLALVIVGAVALTRLGSVKDAADALHDEGLVRRAAIDTVEARTFEVRGLSNRIVLDSTPESVANREKSIGEANDALDAAFAAYEASYGGAMPAEVKASFDKAVAANDRRKQIVQEQLVPLARSNADDQAIEVIDGDLTKVRAELVAAIDELNTIEDANTTALKQAANDTYGSARLVLLAVVIASSALALGLGLRTARRIANPLRQAADDLRRVAAGDLTVTVDVATNDEVGVVAEAINTAVSSMRDALTRVSGTAQALEQSSNGLATVATEMSAVAQQTSSQAVEVAASSNQVSGNLQTMSAAAEEMGSSIQDIARNASHASEIAVSAASKAERAGQVMSGLGDASAQVGSVVRTITAIAEQTNLLALNATIEAARAGEAGRGFAVVANEVKELAQATAKATAEIEQTVASIASQSTEAIEVMQEIQSVIQQVNDAQSMIAAAVEEQSATASEIVRAVHEAASGADAIAGAIDGVAEASTSSSTSAEHTLEVSTDLSGKAGELSQLVSQFRV